jgi:pilus assembly protein Flp/PilA
MLNLISTFARDDSGAAAVEYGLLVALIAAVIVAAVALLGKDILKGFQAVCTSLAANVTGAVAC